MISNTFWSDKKVLITGHTGFKGGWLTLWLQSLGAHVCGIALEPDTSPNLFHLARISDEIDHHILDIRHADKLAQTVQNFAPDIVFHLAAQPLVRTSYKTPLESFDTNVMGTANLLEALRDCSSTQAIIVITTDKVYDNLEIPTPYKETDHLGGHDPYSASKAAAEIVTQSYRKSFFTPANIALATARSGNVIGGGDWSEDRLIPDAVKAWQDNSTLEIRSPDAVRPWQHVLDPLAGYIALAEAMSDSTDYSTAWNFGPDQQGAVTVRELVDLAKTSYGQAQIHYHDNHDGPHEAGLLMLDTHKAKDKLGISSRWSLEQSVRATMQWYKDVSEGADARALSLTQIDEFMHEPV